MTARNGVAFDRARHPQFQYGPSHHPVARHDPPLPRSAALLASCPAGAPSRSGRRKPGTRPGVDPGPRPGPGVRRPRRPDAADQAPPAVYVPDLCVYHYRVGTRSADCQRFVDQALGYYYSYVWIEAARSAETALRYDPECAYAWLVLHKGLEKWGQGDAIGGAEEGPGADRRGPRTASKC